jgi:hypothetical protein
VQEFIAYILPENRYPLKPDAPSIFRELQQCKIDVLILPQEFDPPYSSGTAQLTLNDALSLLKKLHELIIHFEQQNDQENVNHCRSIARDIIEKQDENERRTLLIHAEGLKILEGYDCLQKKHVAVSPSDVKSFHRIKLLFLYSQGLRDARWGLAPKFQKAIEDKVVLINSMTAELVFGRNHNLFPCNADSILDSLGNNILSLQGINNRKQLLPDLAAANLHSQSQVKGLRYLLHGADRHFDDFGTLWVPGFEQNPIWPKLWRLLDSYHEDGWNLLDRSMVGAILPDQWQKLSIREIKAKGILDELRVNGTSRLAGEQFDQDERYAVLREIDRNEELWRKLPFHETVNGRLVCITTGRAFLATDIFLPEELLQNVDIIIRSNDLTIKRQQKEWIPFLSPEGIIRIALQQANPEKFWILVLDNLEVVPNLLSDPLLRNTPWLPDKKHVAVKPSDILYLEMMQAEVDRLLSKHRGTFCSPENLLDDLQKHPSFSYLKKNAFATGHEGFEKLARLLGETNEYHVGKIEYQKDDFYRIVEICSRLPVHLRLPGWVLFSCGMRTSQEMAKEYLLTEILKPIDLECIIDMLRWLQKEHTNVGYEKKEDILVAFNAYLSAAANAGLPIEKLSSFLLLNREGLWKPSIELCAGVEGVDDAYLLDEKQRIILSKIICKSSEYERQRNATFSVNIEPIEIERSSENLRKYFSSWGGLISSELICAFLSLFGDDHGIYDLATQYQGRHSISWVRDQLPWNSMDTGGANKNWAISQHKFVVNIHNDVNAKAYSIMGDKINLIVRKHFKNLIVGGVFGFPAAGFRATRINLRYFSPEEKTPSELSSLLKSTSEYILENSYKQKNVDLGQLWEELDRSEQLDIRIAQQLVLSHIPFYLRQLGVHNHPCLQELLNKWNEARYKQEEYYKSQEKKKTYDAEEREVLEKIKELLKNDKNVQDVVLKAVRAKMKDFQYSLTSIPFELFQNADDAVVELAMINAYPSSLEKLDDDFLPDHVRRFLVIEQVNSLQIAHWGRPVNAVGSIGFPGRERGFHHDLEKMLVLSSSDKSEENKVTGKFGLGFKSVLLASDRPKLLSGRLTTEIVAGICPIPLQDSAHLRNKMHELSNNDRRLQGTLLELPLTDITHREITELFTRLAGIMTIFSKQIRRIDIHGVTSQTWEWKPERCPLNDEACLEVSDLPLPMDINQRCLAVYFRLCGGGVLFALGPDGFRILPDELPAIWVVTPTKESEGLGFAVNCSFDLDVGRARLAGNSTINEKKAHYLGIEFGQALRELYRLSQTEWDELKILFRFENDLPVYNCWASLWKIIGEGVQARGNENISALVSQLFCGENGLGYLITHEDAMPNGLWDTYQVLTRPEKIRIVLKGSIGNASIFKKLVRWDYFIEFIGNPESVITDRVFAVTKKIFPAIGQTTTQWRSVQLSDVLRNFAEKKKKILPDTATTLGSFLNHNDLKIEDFEKERESIEHAIHSFLFKTQDGSFHSADEILVLEKHNRANPDEAKRAAFATKEHILYEEYQDSGLDLFFACRKKIEIPVERMPQWLLDAKDDRQKSHGLRYLLEGEHGEMIAAKLRTKGLSGTWLADLRPASSCFQDWNKQDISEILLRKLPSIKELYRLHTETAYTPYVLPEEALRRHDSKKILQRIHTWWEREKDTQLSDYESRTYPEGVQLNLNEDDVGRIDRESWLILFCLAHFHTIGRQRDVQHKGFIERCLQKGWWDVFSKANPEKRSDEWMGVLEDYIDEQVERSEYEIWMNRFPAIYKFSRWLEDYKDAFLSIERHLHIPDITGILTTRVNDVFQGGGIDAPPNNNSLGIGACFILRELKRKKIINGKQAVPFCYVPVKRVREFCEKIGCNGLSENGVIENSKVIYHYLCSHLGNDQAEFSNCFDIPLQLVAEKEELLRMILN